MPSGDVHFFSYRCARSLTGKQFFFFLFIRSPSFPHSSEFNPKSLSGRYSPTDVLICINLVNIDQFLHIFVNDKQTNDRQTRRRQHYHPLRSGKAGDDKSVLKRRPLMRGLATMVYLVLFQVGKMFSISLCRWLTHPECREAPCVLFTESDAHWLSPASTWRRGLSCSSLRVCLSDCLFVFLFICNHTV